MKVEFGDLPDDAKNLLSYATQIDFAPWVIKAPRWFSAWARDENGDIAGLFTIEFKYPWEGYVNVVVLDQRCMSSRVLRAIFTAAFSQAVRLTAEVEPHNRRALRQVQRMGFVYEGYRRLGLEGTRDTMMFGMLRHECRYLPGYVRPSSTPLNVRDRVLVDPVVGRDQRSLSRVGADQFDLFDGQGGDVMAFTDAPAFEQVGAAGLPADVVRVDAARHPAGVRGVHLGFGSGRSAYGGADKAVDFPTRPVREVPHLRVAARVNGKRPKQTIVSSVGDGVSEKAFRGHRSPLAEVKNYDH